ncbi:MAG: acyl carrier protein [Bacteroidetes bacterium]|nr:acyl carrier protein [Bacteroidota bacterium]MDA1119629.1 acyl carrier protein [Bacteroidota bacterium]
MKQQIIDYISKELLDGQITVTESEDLYTSGIVDSIGLMRIVSFLEQNFEVKVEPQDLTIENFQSVDSMVNYLIRERNEE